MSPLAVRWEVKGKTEALVVAAQDGVITTRALQSMYLERVCSTSVSGVWEGARDNRSSVVGLRPPALDCPQREARPHALPFDDDTIKKTWVDGTARSTLVTGRVEWRSSIGGA